MEVFTSLAILSKVGSPFAQLIVYLMIIYNIGALIVACMAYSAFNKKYAVIHGRGSSGFSNMGGGG